MLVASRAALKRDAWVACDATESLVRALLTPDPARVGWAARRLAGGLRSGSRAERCAARGAHPEAPFTGWRARGTRSSRASSGDAAEHNPPALAAPGARRPAEPARSSAQRLATGPKEEGRSNAAPRVAARRAGEARGCAQQGACRSVPRHPHVSSSRAVCLRGAHSAAQQRARRRAFGRGAAAHPNGSPAAHLRRRGQDARQGAYRGRRT